MLSSKRKKLTLRRCQLSLRAWTHQEEKLLKASIPDKALLKEDLVEVKEVAETTWHNNTIAKILPQLPEYLNFKNE
jgi:hypothetical protein